MHYAGRPSKKYPLCGDIFEQMGQIISIFEDICPKWEIICRYLSMNYHLFSGILSPDGLFLGEFLDISGIFRIFSGIYCQIQELFVDTCAWNAFYFLLPKLYLLLFLTNKLDFWEIFDVCWIFLDIFLGLHHIFIACCTSNSKYLVYFFLCSLFYSLCWLNIYSLGLRMLLIQKLGLRMLLIGGSLSLSLHP